MPPIRIDSNTADRMLSGAVDPRDVPPGYERVAALLHVLSEDVAPRPLPRANEANRVPARWKISSLAIAAACCLGTGTAAYAAGLPQSASDTASTILAKLGVQTHPAPSHPANHGADVSAVARDHSVSGRAHGAAVSAAARAKGHEHRHSGGADSTDDNDAGSGKGSDISKLATSTTDTGVSKGDTISTAASSDHSRAGSHGSATGSANAEAHGQAAPSAQSGGRPGGSSTTAQ